MRINFYSPTERGSPGTISIKNLPGWQQRAYT